jgi:hypothetical protein
LREVVCPVLELREKNQTFVKVGGGKVDFFLYFSPPSVVVSPKQEFGSGPSKPILISQNKLFDNSDRTTSSYYG